MWFEDKYDAMTLEGKYTFWIMIIAIIGWCIYMKYHDASGRYMNRFDGGSEKKWYNPLTWFKEEPTGNPYMYMAGLGPQK